MLAPSMSSLYCTKILRATAEEKNLAVLCWRLAADAARNYSRQCQKNDILSPQAPSDLEQRKYSIKKIQEANYRLAMALDANALQAFSSYWIFSTNELKEAAWDYRHWMHYSQARDSLLFEQEIAQSQEAVTKYRAVAPEASRFAQEAIHCFQKARQIQQSAFSFLAKEMISYRFKIAAYDAIHSAIMHLNLVAARSCNNTILMDHGSAAASLASQAFYFRIKAAKATQQGDELSALQWSLAASGASNAYECHSKLVELLPSGEEELITCWREALHAAEEAIKERHHVITMPPGKKRDSVARIAFWAEHVYECHFKKIESYLQKKKEAYEVWKKITQNAQNLYSQKMYLHKKRIVTALWKELEAPWQKISFCPTSEREFTCGHSWIYQTVQFLKQASIPCDLWTPQKTAGIIIALTSSLDCSFGIDSLLSPDLFLVDVVADASPHPAAHFYIVQNRLQAEQLPNALFIPHWPQSDLIPRDRTRGARFENIVFFGTLENLAPELTSVEWTQRLRHELGLHFKIESPSRWNDYSTVDCAIGIRDFSRAPHFHKPATKLYNAWLAGVPFIGGSDSAYASDGHPGQDYLLVTSLEELLEHLKRLKEDLMLRSRLVQRGMQSSKAFTKEATLERWKKLIQETLPALALRHQKEIAKKERRKLLLNYLLHCFSN
ncbi:MAG: glycosyltransferase [Chthoniobacterales bacterium]